MAIAPLQLLRTPIAVFASIGLLTTIRLWLASQLGLAPDEAYYWQWSTELALTYPDHPPLVAWMIRVGTLIAGNSALGVRLLFVLAGPIAAVLVYQISRSLNLSKGVSGASAVLASILPAPAAATLLATPDTPLGLCWLAGTLALIRLAQNTSSANWYLFGVAAGGGLLAKHSALLLWLLALMALFFAPRIRRELRTPHPWLATLIALAIVTPHFIAEFNAGLSSIRFQLTHLSGDLPATAVSGVVAIPQRWAALLGGQIGLLTPLIALFVGLALWRHRKNLAPAWCLAAMALLLPIAVTATAALAVHPEQNWAALGHPIAAVIATAAMTSLNEIAMVARVRALKIALFVTVFLITAALQIHVAWPYLPLPAERDPASRLHGWEGLHSIIGDLAKADAVICDNYGLAAEVAWHTRRHAREVPVLGADRAQLPSSPGDWLLLDEDQDWAGARLVARCLRMTPLRHLNLVRSDGALIRKIEITSGRACDSAIVETRDSRP